MRWAKTAGHLCDAEGASIFRRDGDQLLIVAHHACLGAHSGTLPERLAASQRRLKAALAGIEKLKPAAEKFYATLSEEQKREADRAIIFP